MKRRRTFSPNMAQESTQLEDVALVAMLSSGRILGCLGLIIFSGVMWMGPISYEARCCSSLWSHAWWPLVSIGGNSCWNLTLVLASYARVIRSKRQQTAGFNMVDDRCIEHAPNYSEVQLNHTFHRNGQLALWLQALFASDRWKRWRSTCKVHTSPSTWLKRTQDLAELDDLDDLDEFMEHPKRMIRWGLPPMA